MAEAIAPPAGRSRARTALLIAGALLAPGEHPAVEQLYRAGDSGERAAEALGALLAARGITVHDTVLAAGAQGHGMAAALRKTG